MLRDILEHAIRKDDQCELLRSTARPHSVLIDDGPRPDVVILGLRATDDVTLVRALFARWPRAHVVTVMPESDETMVYALNPQRRQLGALAPADLVAALRDAVNSDRAQLFE